MKFLLLSDIHLVTDNPVARLDDLTEVQWEKIEYVFNYASKKHIRYILQAGDLTHTKRSWSLLEKLSSYLITKEQKIFMVKGQHDSYYHNMENQKTTTGILISSGIIDLLNSSPHTFDNIHVYGCSYGNPIPEIESFKSINILVIHAPIGHGNSLNQNHYECTNAETFIKNSKFDLVLCGDIHEKFIVTHNSRIICNTGIMLRHEASKEMLEHQPCFFIYDTKTQSIDEIKIPCSSSKEILSRDHIDKQKNRQNNFDNFIEQVKNADYVHSVNFNDNLKNIIKANKTSKEVQSIIEKYLQEGKSDL